MPAFAEQRYAGVEDEFRVAAAGGRFVTAEELTSRAQGFFFSESGHVPIFEPVYDPDSVGGRIWTRYAGTLYDDYDSLGTLVEAATPLTPFEGKIEPLVDNVLTQRAQVLDVSRGYDVTGISTHVNLLLDSIFQGKDLCDFKARVPSNAFGSIEAQKLGADVALIATHTISPVVAYLLFNAQPAKGALYRPRRNRRMELCLPYIPEMDQMRAGFLFWFAAVDHITDLIKADLRRHDFWVEPYRQADYYQHILSKFPFVISDIRFKRPSYYLGYQLDTGVEDNVMQNGSRALIKTDRGNINIVDLTKTYVEFFSNRLSSMATKGEAMLLDDFLSGRQKLTIDLEGVPKSIRLDQTYFKTATGKSAGSYLNGHEVDDLASIHLRFLRDPIRTVKFASATSPGHIVRNLVQEVQWDSINLELAEEKESVVNRYLLEIPLHQTNDYLKLEQDFNKPEDFLNGIKAWVKTTSELPNPRSIFAYGTLMHPERDKRDFGAVVTSVKSGYVYGEAYDFGDYPVLLENYRTSIVPGVLLSIDNFEETAERFDFYESCHNPNPIFVRALRQVVLDNLESTVSWVYVGNRNSRSLREKLKTARRLSGVWTKTSVRLH